MKYMKIGNTELSASVISLGCMRINGLAVADAVRLLETAFDSGIDFFDHADIYGGGKSEELFSQALAKTKKKREDIFLQSKCGIKKGEYDFSREHIVRSVENILKRLNTSYLDVLLLHRPDTLMEPEEVAGAFDELHASGKVRNFGVSNCNAAQIQLLSKYVNQKIVINQLQFSLTNTGMIDSGLNVNMQNESACNRDGSILEYCRFHDMTIQAWSPFQYGFFEGVFIGSPKYPELNAKLDELAEKYRISPSAVAIAWILRHPAGIQPIAGTTNCTRLQEICRAASVELTRTEWYELYRAAGNTLP